MGNADPGSLIIVITDEQENASRSLLTSLLSLVEKKDLWIAVVDVGGYPCGYDTEEPPPQDSGVPGTSPDAVIAGPLLLGLNMMQSIGVEVRRLLRDSLRLGID